MYKFTLTRQGESVSHDTDTDITTEIVEAFYFFMLGAGHSPDNVASAMLEVGDTHSDTDEGQ